MTKRMTLAALLFLIPLSPLGAQAPAPKKTPIQKLAKLIEPWPAPETMTARRMDALRRELFQSETPLSFTIEGSFGVINKDRDPNSAKRYPALLKIDSAGAGKSIAVSLSARGHLRRMPMTCSFVPLRIEFEKDGVNGTVFEGPAGALKLVTHCQNSKEHEQFVLREYLAYKLSNILTPRSFRARLARVTYVDSASKKQIATRYGLLLEDDGDVARRMDGRVVALERTLFSELHRETLANMMVFQYMIGNTDFSIFALHNVVLVQTPDKSLYPVTYDFDLSGLVHAPYSHPAPKLGLKSVLDRLYRGPCLAEEQIATVLETFRSKKTEMFAAFDTIPDLESPAKNEMKGFLGEFFSTIDRPVSVKRAFINGCSRSTM